MAAIPLAEPVGFQAPHGKHAQSLDMTRSRDEGGERTAAPPAVSADAMGSEDDRKAGAKEPATKNGIGERPLRFSSRSGERQGYSWECRR